MPGPVVLVVDDEPQVLDTLSAFVTRDGFDVVGMLRFEDARRRIADDPPDILITDVRLGKYNGLQLVLQMRDARPDSRIIVLSAYDDPTLREEASRSGAQYLVKPVGRQELVEALGGPRDAETP